MKKNKNPKYSIMTYYLNVLMIVFFVFSGFASAQTKPKIKDDPKGREIYEIKRLVNPVTGKIPDDIRKSELKFAKTIPAEKLKSINATDWINRGPFNVGGRTRALGVDVNDEKIILAGGVSGGMWRSTDSGVSWTKVTAPDQLQSVTAIAQDTRSGHTNTWYYVTGEVSGNSASATGASYRGDGVFKSTDNGVTWTHLASTSTDIPESFDQFFDYCWNVKVSPVNGYVFVATYGAVKRSKDGGESWETVFNSYIDNDYSNATDVAVSSTGIIYAAFDSDGDKYGFYSSDDSGDTWEDITPADFPKTFGRTVIDIAASNENVVYFLTHVEGSDAAGHNLWKYVFDTANNKYTWTNLSANLPDDTGKTGSFDSQEGYDLLIKIKPDDEKFVIIGGTDLWRSTDGFATNDNYTKIGGYEPSNNSYSAYTNHHSDQHSLVFYKSDTKKVISGHDGGLSMTSDITDSTANADDETVDWTSLNAGYLTTQVYAVAMDMETNADPNIISGFQDNGSFYTESDDPIDNWENINGGDGSYCAIVDNSNSIYSSSQNGTVYRNWNDNGTWKWTEVDPDGATGQDFINPFIIDPNDVKVMYYPAGEYIWRNSDLTGIPAYNSDPTSVNWDKLTNTQVAGAGITALDISDEPANILYFGTDDGKIYKVVNANSVDSQKSEVTGSSFPENANIGCIRVNPADSKEVLVSVTNYEVVSIWRTTDGGNTWESISGNLEENSDGSGSGPSVRWVDILRKNDGSQKYFAGTSTGLYSTSNLDGENTQWVQESPDMIGNIIVSMIKIRKDGTVIAGTHGNGVYSARFDVSNSIRKNRIDEIKARIFPNPSTGIFTIQALGNTPAVYRVIIFNMSGQAIFYSEQKNILDLNLNVDLSGQPEGVYNIQVMRGNKAFTYRMLLK